MEITLPLIPDFDLTGDGTAHAWQQAPWLPLTKVGGPAPFQTQAKLLYSTLGIYGLFDCADQRLDCTNLKDGDNLFKEDVVEAFFWPDQRSTLYFEYELSPLGAELPILIPNYEGRFYGWLPWNFTGERRTRKSTAVFGGPKLPGSNVQKWTAEFFIPFALLSGVIKNIPSPGDLWRANLYRIDNHAGHRSHWAWDPATGTSFHDYQHFGTIRFGGA